MAYQADFKEQMEYSDKVTLLLRDYLYASNKVGIEIRESGPIYPWEKKNKDKDFYNELIRKEIIYNDATIVSFDDKVLEEPIKVEIKVKRESNFKKSTNWLIKTRHLKKYLHNETKLIYLVVASDDALKLKSIKVGSVEQLRKNVKASYYDEFFKESMHICWTTGFIEKFKTKTIEEGILDAHQS